MLNNQVGKRIEGTENYVWRIDENNCLGKGACGEVYKAHHKVTGREVAVKTFQKRFLNEKSKREFQLLSKINHKNVVTLLSVEMTAESRDLVLVMEYCNGGSLWQIINQPENRHGLKEDEFLLVLEHLAAGMKYLRDNNIVHRDLKPGNILRHIEDDGSSVYKLVDFGSARQLENDEQQFPSICGTEEYLHPDVHEMALYYQRYLKPNQLKKNFSAEIDLWSIGATLYHVVTGNVPFRPFGGRKNPLTMYKMTTEKECGVISAVQESKDGPIQWSTQLPATCSVSKSLKEKLVEMFASLMESDMNKMLTFDQFFGHVVQLTGQRNPLHVYWPPCHHLLRFYLSESDDMNIFVDTIAKQTGISPNSFIFLHGQNRLTDLEHIKTSERDPILALSTPVPLTEITPERDSLEDDVGRPTTKETDFSEDSVNFFDDFHAANSYLATGYYFLNKVQSYSIHQELLAKTMTSVINFLRNWIFKLHSERKLLENQVNWFSLTNRNATKFFLLNCDEVASDVIKQMQDDQMSIRVKNINERIESTNKVLEESLQAVGKVASISTCLQDDKCVARSEMIVKKMKNICKDFERRRHESSIAGLTFHLMQVQKLERKKLKEYKTDVSTLVATHCRANLEKCQHVYSEWSREVFPLFCHCEETESEIDQINDGVATMQKSEQIWNHVYRYAEMKNNKDADPNASMCSSKAKFFSSPTESNQEKIFRECVQKGLSDIKLSQMELQNVLQENQQMLIKQIVQLTGLSKGKSSQKSEDRQEM